MTDTNLLAQLKSQDNWLITTHKGPDGDAIGSVVAWGALAQQLGKKYLIVFPDQPAAYLCPFLNGYNWEVFSPEKHYPQNILFALDYNAPGRVGEHMSAFVADFPATKVMLDHHPDPAAFCELMISDTAACSTTEVIFKTLEKLDLVHLLNEPMAKGLYLGLVTDTGSFRFPSVSAYTHQMVVALLQTGLQHFLIHEAVYDVNSVTRLQLRGYAIAEKLELFADKRIGLISLSKEELKRFAYQKGDTEGLVNVVLSIEGYEVGVFLLETDEGVKLSFRSKGGRYVNAFAQKYFAGGGHQYAAGGFSSGTLTEVLQELKNLLDQL